MHMRDLQGLCLEVKRLPRFMLNILRVRQLSVTLLQYLKNQVLCLSSKSCWCAVLHSGSKREGDSKNYIVQPTMGQGD